MNPYVYVAEEVLEGDSLLALCAGIGLELAMVRTKDITAVDIFQPYLDKLKEDYPHANTVHSDTLEFLKEQPDKSFDVVSFLDGVEHMTKEDGKAALKECLRVAKRKVFVFTPEGYLKNEPHNAWDIEGADEYQRHKSGWSIKEIEDLGYDLLATAGGTSQHGEPYTALLFTYDK